MKGARRRWLGLAAACVAMALAAGAVGGQPRGDMGAMLAGENQEGEARLRALFQDISTINLLNGLRLTREQTQAVLDLAREAERRRAAAPDADLYRVTLAKALEAYEAFKAEANKGEPPGQRLSRNAVYYEHRIQALQAQRARHADGFLAELDQRLQKVLTEGQLQIVESFEPCLVPPRDLKDPVRAGQVESDRGVKMLARLRGIPQGVWDREKERIAERHVKMAIEGDQIEITDATARASARRAFIEAVERARGMSDVQFEMEKGTLAAAFSRKQARQALFERSRVVRPKALPQRVSRAARWLLHPRVIPILEARLASSQPFQGAAGAAAATSP